MQTLTNLEFSASAFFLSRHEFVLKVFTLPIANGESLRIFLKLSYIVRLSDTMIALFTHSEDVYVLPRVAYLGILAL